MLGKKRDVILNRKKNVSNRGKSLKVSIPNKGKQKKATAERYSEKVYCENCVDLIISRTGNYNCHSNSNKLITKPAQEWLSPDTGFALKEHPSSKNRRNQCPDFIEKIG